MATKIENPQIIQFDRDDQYLTIVDLVAFNMDLQIVERASSFASADKVFEKIQKKIINPNIAIVSSYLGESTTDGEKIAAKLRELVPGIYIIAYSIIDDITWGDRLVPKSPTETTMTIVKALEEVTGKTFKGSNVTDENRGEKDF